MLEALLEAVVYPVVEGLLVVIFLSQLILLIIQ